MYCPQVMPPIGVSCQEVNGVCQITPLTPITTTTIPPTTTTIENCAKEGEMFSPVYSQYPKHCCSGLTEWMSGMDSRIVQNGKCVETGLLKGSPIGICIKCGDGICSLNENICNCPQDCAFTTTTIPPTTTTIVSCVPEGQSIPVTSLGLQQQCCPGLTLCPPPSELIGSRGICLTSCNTTTTTTIPPTTSTTKACVSPMHWYNTSCINGQCVKVPQYCAPEPECITNLDCSPTTTTIPPTTTTTVPSCTDSDGGNNPYVKGTVTYNGQTSTDFCPMIIPSGIPSTTEVYEFYCENGVMKQVTITCPTGTSCQDGACKSSVTTTTTVPSCTDSDGGMNPYEKGTVMYNNQIYTDTCSDPNTLIEYSCGNGQIQKVVYPCEPNFTCQDGACNMQRQTSLMDVLNKLTASLMSLMELLKH
jgi:hypothetical protein